MLAVEVLLMSRVVVNWEVIVEVGGSEEGGNVGMI